MPVVIHVVSMVIPDGKADKEMVTVSWAESEYWSVIGKETEEKEPFTNDTS